MRPELPHILRSYAADLNAAGPQYATMSAVLKEAADALESPVDTNAAPNRSSADIHGTCVFDDDAIPGLRCIGYGCEA